MALLLLSASAQPRTITGKAVGVSDGDTIAELSMMFANRKTPLLEAKEYEHERG